MQAIEKCDQVVTFIGNFLSTGQSKCYAIGDTGLFCTFAGIVIDAS